MVFNLPFSSKQTINATQAIPGSVPILMAFTMFS